ncbi:hypothetical protein ACPTKM_00270 [Pseudomonas aeruginosa]|uniref:hypothetical protein n=1 Tax=Pseudomonas aeruginosa TaxID=287 RepID=UPI003CC526F5
MSKDSTRGTQALTGLKALQALLTLACRQPLHFNKDPNLRSALKSQGGLARLNQNIELGPGEVLATFPMSLNTLKTYANENLSGGFKALNDLRLAALDALEKADNREKYANRRSKSGLNRRIEQLEFELEMQRQTNMILLRALSESMHQFTSIRDASDNKIRDKRTQDALQTLRAIVSMGMPPFNIIPSISDPPSPSVTVTNIDDYRKR